MTTIQRTPQPPRSHKVHPKASIRNQSAVTTGNGTEARESSIQTQRDKNSCCCKAMIALGACLGISALITAVAALYIFTPELID